MARIKGLEALFSTSQKEFKSKEDCVIAAIHTILINADLLCVGTGEEFSDKDAESVTELLPNKWNEDQDVYCLRYKCENLKKRYLLKVVKAGNSLHINLVLDEDKSSGMTINTEDYIGDDYSGFSQAFKNIEQLNKSFQEEVLKKVYADEHRSSTSTSKESPKKKTPKTPDPIPAVVPIPQVYPIPSGVPDLGRYGGSPLIPNVGGRDLDMFGRSGGGGMLFDPSNMGIPSRPSYGMGPLGRDPMGLPPNAIPPGARFDPFSPIGANRSGPDADHFRPPDYGNMFM